MFRSKNYLLVAALCLSLFACKKELDITPTANNSSRLADADISSIASINLISNVTVTSDSTVTPADTAYQVAILAKGVTYYTDRTYTINALSDSLANLPMIKTSNADKHSTSDSYLTFTLAQPATVYVAVDPRAASLPTWLQGWQKLTDTVGIDEPIVDYYAIYSKTYPAGTVILGGASASGSDGVLNQYFVFAKAIPVPPIESTIPAGAMFGVNGHSLGVEAYTAVSPEEQIGLLKKMGMTCFRQDITFMSDGTISNLKGFKALNDVASANGVTILPTVYPRTFNMSASESDSYAAGKVLGTNVATKNSGYFKYYELGNEFDNVAIISGNGDQAADYDTHKLKIIAAYLKGMDDGIKSVQPTAKTMIDASWLHYYFLQYLIANGNNFDIVAWHWYSDMEATATRIRIPDISIKLGQIFNKPIWFTEVGQRPDPNAEQLQNDYITSFVKKVKPNPNVGAILCYELFDEPKKSKNENSYGLIKWTVPYATYKLKMVANTLSANRY